MDLRRQLLIVLTLTLVLGPAGDTLADISNAAVLFLRIAPGSRAAGMGEAYVAMADDATATHWNPAGLGSYPLADTWIEAGIPAAYRPLKGFAPLSTGGGHNYLDYDIWAITTQGLIRYDNKRWHTDEVFSTRTDETVEQKVKAYFRVEGDTRIAEMVDRVAAHNNRGTFDGLQALRDSVLAAMPAEYDRREALTQDFDSLLAAYRLCRVNWDRVDEMREKLADGLKDGPILSDSECDRVAVAAERARNRFLPEELRLPFDALFTSEPTAIASTGEMLLIGSSDGLARYNGNFWEFVLTEEGAPVAGVTALHAVGGSVIVGTTDGLGVFRGQTVGQLTGSEAGLPDGSVDALGGTSLTDLYVVIGEDLYRFNGMRWSNATSYKVAVDDSIDRIAARYSIYGSEADRQRFVDKYRALYDTVEPVVDQSTSAQVDAQVVPDTAAPVQGATEASEALLAGGVPTAPGIDSPLEPGTEIRVPLVAGVKGEVRTIYVDTDQRLWLGTDHGIFLFDGSRWSSPGYEDHTIAEGEVLEALVNKRSGLDDEGRAAYRALLVEINDLGQSEPAPGTSIRLYANPAAQAVNGIGGDGRKVLFATENGLIEFDGRNWSRTGLRGLTHDNIMGVSALGNESWIASDEKLVIKGRGHSEISVMHVNWLPELADDLYYEFLSAVTPVEGWGTFGGSVTFISYGKFTRTGETGEVLGEFESFDIAGAISYGTSLTNKLKGGISVKLIHSRLSPQGAGAEQGSGTATGFAIDVGLLYHMNSRLTWGLAFTNLGPEMSYIDADQSDDLPRNLAIGFSYKMLRSDYTSLIVTAEINKLMVGLDDRSSEELQQSVINGGLEFTYANLFAARAGYIYDQEGDIKTPTLGFGVAPFSWGEFDFAYIPSQEDFSLANTLRISLRLIL